MIRIQNLKSYNDLHGFFKIDTLDKNSSLECRRRNSATGYSIRSYKVLDKKIGRDLYEYVTVETIYQNNSRRSSTRYQLFQEVIQKF
jgi:hypothetical protein